MRSSGIEETAKRTGADFWGAGALRVVVILIPCSHRDAAKAVRLPWLGLGSVGRCPNPATARAHCRSRIGAIGFRSYGDFKHRVNSSIRRDIVVVAHPDGERHAQEAGDSLRGTRHRVGTMLCSSAVRARQTPELLKLSN
jgi:hypothetical protein